MAMRDSLRMLGLVAAGLACAGCAGHTPPQTPARSLSTATTAPPPVAAPRTVKWIDLQARDCLAGRPPTDPAEVMVTVVDCATPHLAEAFLRAEIPVDTALTDNAAARCEAGFVDFSGRPATAGGFTITYLIDSEQDRTSSNPYPSTIICLAQSASGQSLTGPAAGR